VRFATAAPTSARPFSLHMEGTLWLTNQTVI
jgi:hypothetical protein